MEKIKINKKSQVGKVIADSSEKTVKVEIENIIQHKRFKKYIKRHTRFLVHDPEEKCKVGDKVKIEECRPISKCKKWIIREIVKAEPKVEGDQS